MELLEQAKAPKSFPNNAIDSKEFKRQRDRARSALLMEKPRGVVKLKGERRKKELPERRNLFVVKLNVRYSRLLMLLRVCLDPKILHKKHYIECLDTQMNY